MPDERMVERMMERMLEGLALLTQQVARHAYATEQIVIYQLNADVVSDCKKCRACQSRIQPKTATHCLACGEYIGDG